MIARLALATLVALGLAACAARFDGQDGMDGRGVAAGLRHMQQQHR